MSEVRAAGGLDEQQMLRLAKVLSDPLRLDILYRCNIGEVSPRIFRQQASGAPSLANLQQDFAELEHYGWIERVPSAGGQPPEEFDRLYRSNEAMIVDEETWSQLPQSVKSSVAQRIVEGLATRTKEAMKAGTMVARDDSHRTWMSLILDRQGWESVIERVDALFEFLVEERKAAKERLDESGEESILMTVGLLAFESPRH